MAADSTFGGADEAANGVASAMSRAKLESTRAAIGLSHAWRPPAYARMETLERGIELEYSWTMPSAEYQQLVEFLGRRFTEIDRRFDALTRLNRAFIKFL